MDPKILLIVVTLIFNNTLTSGFFLVDYFTKDCCKSELDGYDKPICVDHSYAPMIGACCGRGKCNMACCNCDGGCRGKPGETFNFKRIHGSITPNLDFFGPSQAVAGTTINLIEEGAKAIGSAVFKNKDIVTNGKK